jgi:hypothetical protein
MQHCECTLSDHRKQLCLQLLREWSIFGSSYVPDSKCSVCCSLPAYPTSTPASCCLASSFPTFIPDPFQATHT